MQKIKKITCKFPELFKEDACETFFIELCNYEVLKQKLSETTTKAIELEQELKKVEKDIFAKKAMFDIEYEDKTVKEIHNEVHIQINNEDDARNK